MTLGDAFVGSPEDLDPNALLVEATENASLADYGDRSFVEPLTRWLEAVVTEGNLNAIGFMAVKADVIRLLINRLRFQDDLKQHPEILKEEVSDPIIILGMARTGTTKLQRMMSCDPAVQKLPFWRLMNPAPLPGSKINGPDPRISLAKEYLGLLAQNCPDIMAAHPVAAEEPDEEVVMMEMTFECLSSALRAHIPSYMRWWLTRPRQGPYQYLYRLLQYLQWQDGGGRGRPWILKAPAHLGNLDVLFATFPEATVVHCHRDPTVALPSTLRLTEVYQCMTSDQIDLHENGEMMLTFFSDEMTRNLTQREQLGDNQRIVDAQYAEICDEPLRIIREVYRLSGHELSVEAAGRMTHWAEENPQHQFGKHSYSLERYGLTKQQVEQAFASYCERFVAVGNPR